ncbi:hypothetical protein GCM10023322_63110 [Rugosimonospora acidiphila]|uniref:Zinc ribbon domain-containing protein n=1 Tax=Rugosimonospora acidiphila TaxID=556531 RepID=A0ABP9SG57_9ACTN
MRIDVATTCVACGAEISGGAPYCPSCGTGQPDQPAVSQDPVPLVDSRVTPPLLPTQPSTGNLILVTAIIVLVIVATVPVLVIRSVFFGPDDAVRGYFNALAARNADAAWAQLDPGGLKRASDPMLSDRAVTDTGYHPPTGFKLVKLKVDGADATASVRYTVDGQRQTEQVTLHRGRATNLFQRWHVKDGLLPLAVQVPAGASYQLGGSTMTGADSAGQFAAFPGAYRLTLAHDPLLDASPVTVVAGQAQGGTLVPRVQSAAQDTIGKQVKAYVDKCATSTALTPQGCPFYASSYYAEPVHWQVLSYPTLRETINENGQVTVDSQAPGSVSITGGPDSFAPPETFSFSVSGTAAVSGDSVVFTPPQQQ